MLGVWAGFLEEGVPYNQARLIQADWFEDNGNPVAAEILRRRVKPQWNLGRLYWKKGPNPQVRFVRESDEDLLWEFEEAIHTYPEADWLWGENEATVVTEKDLLSVTTEGVSRLGEKPLMTAQGDHFVLALNQNGTLTGWDVRPPQVEGEVVAVWSATRWNIVAVLYRNGSATVWHTRPNPVIGEDPIVELGLNNFQPVVLTSTGEVYTKADVPGSPFLPTGRTAIAVGQGWNFYYTLSPHGKLEVWGDRFRTPTAVRKWLEASTVVEVHAGAGYLVAVNDKEQECVWGNHLDPMFFE
jgi:hypothetical protein